MILSILPVAPDAAEADMSFIKVTAFHVVVLLDQRPDFRAEKGFSHGAFYCTKVAVQFCIMSPDTFNSAQEVVLYELCMGLLQPLQGITNKTVK